MPGAHLDTEAGQFMFRVSVLDSAFNSLQKKKMTATEHQAIQPDLLKVDLLVNVILKRKNGEKWGRIQNSRFWY